MIRVLQAILKFYFKRFSPRLRLLQVNYLVQFVWIKLLIEGIRDELELDQKRPGEEEIVEEVHVDSFQKVQPIAYYKQYRCSYANPLMCPHAQEASEKKREPGYCMECGFPATLPEKAEIRGTRGRYRVENLVASRGVGRLYNAVQVQDGQSVVLKEYLLPNRYFNAREARQRQDAFVKLAGLNLADGRVQDARLVSPWEAIADMNLERAYLVSKGELDTYQTMSTYLEIHGKMKPAQVRKFLNQVLQTLEFLHSQKYRLPAGQVQQGIPHGNLCLESLLIRPDGDRFYIYVCDLAMWERVFDPPQLAPKTPTLAQDLVELGYMAFYILAGHTIDTRTGRPMDPLNIDNWPKSDDYLRRFMLRMMEHTEPFESAIDARQTLLRLTKPPLDDLANLDGQEETAKVKIRRAPVWLWVLVAFLLIAALGWLLFQQFRPATRLSNELIPCCFKDIQAIPGGDFNYTATKGGTWSAVLEQASLALAGRPLEVKLQDFQPKLKLKYTPAESIDESIQKVWASEVNFAIVPWFSDSPNPVEKLQQNLVLTAPQGATLSPQIEVTNRKIAYDGLLVFVSFSYARRQASLPTALNGKITYDQLRLLYTGRIQNWKELGGPDLPVRLYVPKEPETIKIFEERVLQNPDQINTFRGLVGDRIQTMGTFEILRTVIQDFERDEVGGISFGNLSKVFGQCSVYPLALVDGDKPPVQALTLTDNTAIDPSTNLCDTKGSYRPDVKLFQQGNYPLSYPLMVIYPRDNSRPPVGEKFADLLRTQEGQRLLIKAGLVPFQQVARS